LAVTPEMKIGTGTLMPPDIAS